MNTEDFKSKLKTEHKPIRYRHFDRGSKYGSALLTRIRIGRSFLNDFTFHIGFTDTPKCLCEHPHQNSPHYLIQCFLYTEERRTLFD